MDVFKNLKSIIIYYYIGAIVFLGFTIFGATMSSDWAIGYGIIVFYILIPISTFLIGLFAGVTDNSLKWGIPLYLGLLAFSLPVIVFGSEEWFIILRSFGLSLLGIIIGHIIKSRRGKK